jgi:hypothetical protein
VRILVLYWRADRGGPLFLGALVAALALLSAGCRREIPTYPVRGKVVYKDGEAVRGGLLIWFESLAPPHHRSRARVDEKGEFVLSFIAAGSGAPEGEHRIGFEAEPPYPEPTAEAALGKKMPPRYLEYRTSGLKQNIVRGENEFVIKVDRPSKR